MYLPLLLTLAIRPSMVSVSIPTQSSLVLEKSQHLDSQHSTNIVINQSLPATQTSTQEVIADLRKRAVEARAAEKFDQEADFLIGVGLLYSGLGEPKAGLEDILAGLEVARRINKLDSQSLALNTLGQIYQELGEYQKAKEFYQQSVTVFSKQQATAKNISALLSAWLGLATINRNLGETKEVVKYHDLTAQKAKEFGNVKWQAQFTNAIGGYYSSLGNFKEAIKYHNASKRLDPTTQDNIVLAELFLTPTNSKSQQPEQSIPQNQRETLLADAEKIVQEGRLAKETYRELGGLDTLSGLYGNSDYPKAYKVAQRKLELLKPTGRQLKISQAMVEIAEILNRWDRKQEALNFYQQALDIQQRLGIRPQQAKTMNAMGDLYRSLGSSQLSLESYTKALNLSQYVGDFFAQELAFNGIVKTLKSTGDTTKALEIVQDSMKPLAEISGNRLSKTSVFLLASDLFRQQNDYQSSLKQLQELQKSNLLGDGDGDYHSSRLFRLGLTYQKMKDYPKAQAAFEESLAIATTRKDPGLIALRTWELGTLYKESNRPQQAQQAYEKSIALFQKLQFRSDEAQVWADLANLQRSQKQLLPALKSIESAINTVEDVRKGIVSNDLRTSFLALNQNYYRIKTHILMDLHQQQPNRGYDRIALENSERGRARGLIELLTEAGFDRQIKAKGSTALTTQEVKLEQDLRAVEKQRVTLLSREHTPAQVTVLESQSNDLINQIQILRNRLRTENPAYAALKYPETITFQQIQQILDKDSVMLQYALGRDRSYLWLVTPTGIQSYILPGEAELETAAKVFQSTLTSSGSINDVKRTGDHLYQNILAPVANQIVGKRLIVVADGVLQYIPFAAIPLPNTTRYTPLLQKHEIVNAPSAATLAVIRKQSRRAAPKTLSVIADPVFRADDTRLTSSDNAALNACLTDTKQNLNRHSIAQNIPIDLQSNLRTLDLRDIQRLPNTRIEATQILSLVPPSQRNAYCALAANYNTIAQTKKSQLDQYKIVHFATHGFINSSNPQLSGLVLSLVNSQRQPQDGFLRLHDIFNLNLNADLVVLSACQTGLGENIRGEGIVGLTRGFMYAGTNRVVTSLWNVDDAQTAQLMSTFYQKMLQGRQTPSLALRSAQLQQWQRNPDPRFWAAFTMQGEWLP